MERWLPSYRRLARTIADIAGADQITAAHVAEAVQRDVRGMCLNSDEPLALELLWKKRYVGR
jgi:hypothetical protein